MKTLGLKDKTNGNFDPSGLDGNAKRVPLLV